jgi:hypothetical protein
MHVTVNGEEREIPEGLSVRGLVETLGLNTPRRPSPKTTSSKSCTSSAAADDPVRLLGPSLQQS